MVLLPSKIQGCQGKILWADLMIEANNIQAVRAVVPGEGFDEKHSIILIGGINQVINASFDEVCAAQTTPDDKILVVQDEIPSMTLGKGGEA